MDGFNVKKQEEMDFEMLSKLNDDVFHLYNLERRVKKTEQDPIDASGKTSDDKVINIEIKSRDCNIDTYQSLMIETHKALPLLNEYIEYDRIPLYVNFLKDEHVVVYNMLKIPEGKKFMKREKTWSKLYKCWEWQYKEYISIDAAFIYKKVNNQYKLIQKGWN